MDVGADAEKLKKRAERFGKSVASTTASVKGPLHQSKLVLKNMKSTIKWSILI